MQKAESFKNKSKMKKGNKKVSNLKLKIWQDKEIIKSKIRWKILNRNLRIKWGHFIKISAGSSFKIQPLPWTIQEWNTKFVIKSLKENKLMIASLSISTFIK